jgi:hypothetical protein
MRIVPIIAGVILFTSACAANTVYGCAGPVPVTSSLVFGCAGDEFVFGQNINNQPQNPLPLGGSVILKSAIIVIGYNGYPEWDLDFGFSTPSTRTTQLNFAVFGKSSFYSGVSFVALGRSPSPFGTQPPNDSSNTPNETGSNFLITETVTDIHGSGTTLTVCGGNGFPSCDGSIVNQSNYNPFGNGEGAQAVEVTTLITDKTGDLTGFDEGFATPEPSTWILLLGGGLLAISAVRRRRIH